MSERKLYKKFQDALKKIDPNSFCYKLPDTFYLGGKKPFDFFVVCKGKAFAVEFKDEGESATKYQEIMLRLFELAGGISICFVKGEMTMRQLVSKIIMGNK